MGMGERLMRIRKEHGYSQEELAVQLGISRQAVSKWESDAAAPELSKLEALADLYGVSLDYLVRGIEPQAQVAQVACPLSVQRGWEYRSARTIFGVPLVHVNFRQQGMRLAVARGVIAIGNIAVGGIAIGAFSVGAISIGAIGVGLLAIGAIMFGWMAWAAIAVGVFAMGAVAIGQYAAGATAIGREAAVGLAAIGRAAAGLSVEGESAMELGRNVSREAVRAFLQESCPGISALALYWLTMVL